MLVVSTVTVSLVLDNKPGVGEQKRQGIIRKIKTLGCKYMLKNVPLKRASGNKERIGFVVCKKRGRVLMNQDEVIKVVV